MSMSSGFSKQLGLSPKFPYRSQFYGQFVNNEGEGHSDEEVRDRPLKC